MIDNVDFSILKCLKDTGETMWKKKIHQEMLACQETLPLPQEISLQTLGRRIDKLHKKGYLRNAIINPKELTRDLIIAYRITDQGWNVVEEKREQLLRELVCRELYSDKDNIEIGKYALAALINDEFGLEDRDIETADNYSRDELLVLLGLYFLDQKVSNVFDETERAKFRDVIMENRKITTTICT